MDCKLLLASGGDYPIPECTLTLRQPTIKEISMVGEEDFFTGIQVLTLNKMMFDLDKTDLSNINDFQLFMMIINQKETADKKEAVQKVFFLILKDEKASFTPQSILISGKQGVKTIDENNFNFLQEAIKNIFCLNNSNQDQKNFNPKDDKAKEIAEKLMKGRQRIAAERGEGQGSILGQYISILSIGLHLSYQELLQYTLFQLYDSIQRYGLWVEYDLDIRVRLAGGSPNGNPENWMKVLY